MKKPHRYTIVIWLLIALGFFGKCSLLDWNINGVLSTTLHIEETREEKNITYSSTTMLLADSDDDIKNNLSKLKDWNVNELSYSVKNFVGDPSITFSGTLGFSKVGDSSPSITASITDIKFSEISDNGKKYEINVSESQFDTMSEWFDADHGIKVYIDGILSDGPASVVLKMYVDVRVKVKSI